MSRVEPQLREYFDAGVERVSVDDVIAQAQVGEGRLEPLRSRLSLKPAWAAVAAFGATFVVVGGLALAVDLAPRFVEGSGAGAAQVVEGGSSTLGVWLIAAIAAAVVAGVVVWLMRRPKRRSEDESKREVNRGRVTIMETIESTDREDRVEETQAKRSWWPFAAMVVLGAAVVGLVLWMTLAMRPNSPTVAPPEIVQLMGDYSAAWNAYDVDAIEALVTDDYRIQSNVPNFDYDIDSIRSNLMPLLVDWEWSLTADGSYYAVEDESTGAWLVSSEGAVITRDGAEHAQSSVWRVVPSVIPADGSFLVAEHFMMGG